MADPTYQDAITAQDQPTVRDAALTYLADNGSTVGGLPTSSPDRALVEGEAFFIAEEQSLRAAMATACNITDAAQAGSSWVDTLASWYQVPNGRGGVGRIPATTATWTIPLIVAPSAAPLTLKPGDVVQLQATDANNSVFVLAIATPLVLSASSSYKGVATFAARLSGTKSGNVTPGTIANVIAGPAGLRVDLTGTQTLSAARDAETDSALIARCLASWYRLGAAWTSGAFDYLIPSSVPAVTKWRVDDANPYGPGTVGVALADQGGPSSAGECATVQTLLNAPSVRPLGSGLVTVLPATTDALMVNVTIKGDGSNSQLAANAQAAAFILGQAFPIGPAVFDNVLLESVLLGGAYTTIAVDAGSLGLIERAVLLPGFRGAVEIVSINISAPHAVPYNGLLTITCNVVVV